MTMAVGSLDALAHELRDNERLALREGAHVVVVPTAAAFVGSGDAANAVASLCEEFGYAVEALMIDDRAASHDPSFVQRIGAADLVVLCDGSPLHARATWRATPVGESLERAACLVAIGSVATVLGEVMIDPRGGAPTTGLGYRRGVAFAVAATEEQTARTRSLLASDVALVVLGRQGVVAWDGASWRVINDDVVVTRGPDVATL